MTADRYFNREIETLDRDRLDEIIAERVRYTVRYANEHSPFYRGWFRSHGIDPASIRTHEDLSRLPVISGSTIRSHQPPVAQEFGFHSAPWDQVFTIHETSGTSGTPKAFFLTWQDWERYAEKYARIFVSQGFGPGDRVVVCASYGMNVGANTMTLAARYVGMAIIPQGTCAFPGRVITSYRPTGIVGSVFKLLNLARRLEAEGIDPRTSGIRRLVAGGESFAPESRAYLAEVWDCPVHNTYGSTEGTMCGECDRHTGLHVPEDLVHLDVYDPALQAFVPEGECGRIVLTTLIPPGSHCGMLLLNYDTEDTTVILSRETCACGRTHLRIQNPQREAETFRAGGAFLNRVDVERGVFQRGNMEYLTGDYEAFLTDGDREGSTVLQVTMESQDPARADRDGIADRFVRGFIGRNPYLQAAHDEDLLTFAFSFSAPGTLAHQQVKGRPKRLVDRRTGTGGRA
ncbi:MAG: coenzyme F390 synthetase [Methanomicrobiales archaeon]|nr:coenzyme F390 synthetase [Methanomicrobiales archaeon]